MNRLLILDVDGVMTDGTKTYGIRGEVLSKRFCDHDFTAIKKFKDDGWDVGLTFGIPGTTMGPSIR